MNWKPIKGYEEYYEMSEDKIVRSIDRWDGRAYKKGKVIKAYKKDKDSDILYVRLCKKNKATCRSLERVYAETYLGENRNIPKNNHIGVYKRGGRWVAQGYNYGKVVYIGSHKTENGALDLKIKFEEEKKNVNKA